MNENLQKLVQLAKDKKATEFKAVLTTEIESRLSTKIAAMKSVLSKTMFSKQVNESSNEPGEAPSPSSVEHTHEDGTTHSHVNGDEKHVHEGKLPPALQKAVDAKKGKKDDDDEDDEEDTKDEGTLPPALQKAIDAKKGKKKDDDEDDDDDDVEENIANFGKKKAKPFKKDK